MNSILDAASLDISKAGFDDFFGIGRGSDHRGQTRGELVRPT